MANVNTVILIGTLTRDPELKYLPKGTAVAQVSLAINRTWSDDSGTKKEEVTFVDVDVFGRTAENVGQYMRKGSPILIEGRLRLDQWDDKQTGQKRSKLKVIGESMQMLGGPRGGGGGDGDESERPARPGKSTPPPKSPSPAAPDDDEIPF